MAQDLVDAPVIELRDASTAVRLQAAWPWASVARHVNLGGGRPRLRTVLLLPGLLRCSPGRTWGPQISNLRIDERRIGMLGARTGHVTVGGSRMYYNVFGRGTDHLVLIPGLGDGLRTVKGMALAMAWMFRAYAREYRVWVFSRRDVLETGTTTRDMASDLVEAMDQLGIAEARVMGVSQGGMIGQWLAIDAPERVSRLTIAVSLATQNETVQSVIRNWVRLAEDDQFGDLAVDTMHRTYTEKGLRRWRPFMWLVRLTSRPQSKERFLVQARSCLTHDALSELGRIRCPTLVIGGALDQIVGGAETQETLAAAIPDSTLHVYPDYGHAAYEEAKDFNDVVLAFFRCHAPAPVGGRGG